MIINKTNRLWLKNKKILVAQWGCESEKDVQAYPRWYLPFKQVAKKIMRFDTKKNYMNYGKEKMGQMLLETIKKEKPDLIFFLLIYDEIDPLTLIKIKEISPRIMTLNVATDDYWRYEDFGRLYALFFDYIVVNLCPRAITKYQQENIKNVFFSYGGNNTEEWHPLNLKKKYDIGFIGTPGKERLDIIRFLLKKGFKIDLWGNGWAAYPEFKKIYHGTFKSTKWSEVVNQIKINLNSSIAGNGSPQLKGRPWEIGCCKSFVLSDYFKEYEKFFIENKEIVMFKNKNDLTNKVRYYLKNVSERERIAEAMHKRIIKEYSLKQELNKILDKMRKNENSKENLFLLPFINKKVFYINMGRMVNTKILKNLKKYDYICFDLESNEAHKLKEYLQIYSLEKSQKEISCCDYYVNSKNLGNYLLFKSKQSFNKNPNEFKKIIVPEQLMFKSSFFVNNFESIKTGIEKNNLKIINEKNTTFISIPLFKTNKIKKMDYKTMKNSFQPKFLDKLYSLKIRGKLFLSIYPYFLLLNSINNPFVLKSLKGVLLDGGKIEKLKKGF